MGCNGVAWMYGQFTGGRCNSAAWIYGQLAGASVMVWHGSMVNWQGGQSVMGICAFCNM